MNKKVKFELKRLDSRIDSVKECAKTNIDGLEKNLIKMFESLREEIEVLKFMGIFDKNKIEFKVEKTFKLRSFFELHHCLKMNIRYVKANEVKTTTVILDQINMPDGYTEEDINKYEIIEITPLGAKFKWVGTVYAFDKERETVAAIGTYDIGEIKVCDEKKKEE